MTATRRNLAIAAGAAVLILLLWYLLLWSPRNKTLKKERSRAETAEQARDQARNEVARLRAAQRDEPAIRARLEGLRTAIPDQPNLAQFILDTNDAAIRAGIDFVSVAPALPAAATAAPGAVATAPVAGSPPAEIKAQLQITGGYFQVLDFLNRLDAMPRLVVTDSVNVASDPSARLTVGASVRLFLRAIPPEYGGAAVPGAVTTTTVPSTTATTVAGATTTSVPGGTTTTTTAGQP